MVVRDHSGGCGERDTRSARGADRFGRGGQEKCADHEARDHARGTRGRDKARTTCRNIFSWPFRCHDDEMDEDSDYDHPGFGGISGACFRGFDEKGPIRRDRSRSPPRRSSTYRGHGQGGLNIGSAPAILRAQFVHVLHAVDRSPSFIIAGLDDMGFLSSARRILDLLPHGDAEVAVGLAKTVIPVTTVPVRRVLDLLHTSLFAIAATLTPRDTSLESVPSVDDVAAALTSLENRLDSSLAAHVGAPTEVNPVAVMVVQNLADRPVTAGDNGPPPMTKTTARATPQDTPEQIDDNTQGDTDDAMSEGVGVDALFCTPPVPLLQQPAARQPRQRRVFEMKDVRRSAQLAGKLSIPAVQKAQQNLNWKLGMGNDENKTIDEVL
jgi:hypothetical protein